MIKAYILPPDVPSWAVTRVMDALTRHAPRDMEFVSDMGEAQLVILNVIGRRDKMLRMAKWIVGSGRQYAIVQYVLRGTLKPSTGDWLPLWGSAKVVWSQLDLASAMRQDGVSLSNWQFYHRPFGVDAQVFRCENLPRDNIIFTSGVSTNAECVKEAVEAARRSGKTMIHVGKILSSLGEHVRSYKNIDDTTMARLYNTCEFVAGLRRGEGFELCAAEGLICGCRPIMFDRFHYRCWFSKWARFIPENFRPETTDSLEALFRQGAEPVSVEERNEAMALFNWESIIGGFWQRCL